MNRYLVILLLMSYQTVSHAAVWSNKNKWNAQWEDRYSLWVASNYTKRIFLNGKYAGIKHDCADSAYFARLVFAYENKLPFVIKDPRFEAMSKEDFAKLARDYPPETNYNPYAIVKPWITNDFDYYDKLPAKERFLRFIRFVGEFTGTESLMVDTYPVKLSRKWFRPGVIAALPRIKIKGGPNAFLSQDSTDPEREAESPGHAQIVTKVDKHGVIHYLKSTVPAKLQAFQHTTLNSFVPDEKGGSFRLWKQPDYYGKPENSLPGYGTGQYYLKGVFEDAMQKRLAKVQESNDQKYFRLSSEVCHQVEQRVPVVNEAWKFKQNIGGRCMDYGEFDSHSTPSRDGKIKKALKYLVQSATGSKEGDVKVVAKYLNKACGSIEYLPGKKITAAKFSQRLMAGKVSSDPNQAPAVRWGDQNPRKLGCKQFY